MFGGRIVGGGGGSKEIDYWEMNGNRRLVGVLYGGMIGVEERDERGSTAWGWTWAELSSGVAGVSRNPGVETLGGGISR